MKFTPEMARFSDREILGMDAPPNAASAYRALAAIRDAAICSALLTAYSSKVFEVDHPPQGRKEVMHAAFRCVHGLPHDMHLTDEGPRPKRQERNFHEG